MRVLAVIPARGGSKRLPRKNILDLGGKPLLTWTINTAKESGVFDKIIVSTEDDEIGLIAKKENVVWHPRPKVLSGDNIKMMDVVLDVVLTQEVFENEVYDVIVLLQPTSPFRTAEDIRDSLNLLIKTKGDSVVSVTTAPSDLAFDVGFAQRLRSIPNIVVPNGALYLITHMALEKDVGWYGDFSYGYEMEKDRSLDIDTELDLDVARLIVQKKYANDNQSK